MGEGESKKRELSPRIRQFKTPEHETQQIIPSLKAPVTCESSDVFEEGLSAA